MSGIGDALTKQVGPLPMGVWLVVGAGGLFIASRRDRSPELVTDVREIPVPVGAIASPDGAPVVITPIFRVPSLDDLYGPNRPTPGAPSPGTPTPTAPQPAPQPPRPPTTPGAPGVAAPGAPPRGTAGYLYVNGARVHVNTAGIIDTPGSYYGKYPMQVLGGTGMAVPGAPTRGTAGYVTVGGTRYHVNAAGIIDTPGPAYGKYPAQL